MADIDLSSYKTLYLETARKYVVSMQNSLQNLISGSYTLEELNQIFISAHSLKSQSITMEYTQIGTLCLLIEHYFRVAKEEQRIDNSEIYTTFLRAIDHISASLQSIEKENHELEISEVIAEVRQYQKE